MENNKYMNEFIANMNSVPLEERMNLRSEYNYKYIEQFKDPDILAINNFVKNSVHLSNNFEDVLISNNKFLLNPMDMIKCLSNIADTKEGQIKLLYFLKTICNISKKYLPLNPEHFYEKSNNFIKNMEVILQYGISNNIIKVQEEDKKLFNTEIVIENSLKDKSASFDDTENDDANEQPDNKESKNDTDEKSVEKETTKDKKEEDKKKKEEKKKKNEENRNDTDEKSVEKETTKDKKEEDKKKKEEKKKKNEENRNDTKKWFDYDSINAVVPDLKNNKAAWYKVANRIATLLIQKEVQNLIGDQKFSILIYNDGNDFAIINNPNNINQNYNIFWFKEKEVERFTDSNLFNLEWAKAHQVDQNKFTA